MKNITSFQLVLDTFRKYALSERDKGDKFERLVQAYLQTDPRYANLFTDVWLWNDFFARRDFGGKDTGIDLVARTTSGDYWAIQCKCFQENAVIDKPAVDSFLSTSSRHFKDEQFRSTGFAHRLWISTTNKWGLNAEEAIRNQNPAVNRIGLHDLENANVDWEKLAAGLSGEVARTGKKTPRPHQIKAIAAAHEHFTSAERGKLIMACGTGKTFTSLKIAEQETGGKGTVLFLVPSIALLGQTLNEWTGDAENPFNAICICSDAGASKKRIKNDDSDGYSVVDLALPASTNVEAIVKQFEALKATPKHPLTVVFSTYQSIEVIAEAQRVMRERGMGNRDLGMGTRDLGTGSGDLGGQGLDNQDSEQEQPYKHGEQEKNELIQRSDSLAGSDEPSRNDLQSDKAFPERGIVRTDESNETGGDFDTLEHSGGERPQNTPGLSSLPHDSTRLLDGTGDPSTDSRTAGVSNKRDDSAYTFESGDSRKTIERTPQIPNPSQALTPSPQSLIPNPKSPIPSPQSLTFDLIICDEAHRTTGVTLADDDESAFVKVHNNDFIQAKKRLYMTATPRLFNDDTKSRAAQAEAVLCSMDDPDIYGEEIYRIGFGEAVNQGLLSDYKVLILTVSENDMTPAVQKMVSNDQNEINADDTSKLIGCINALSKKILGDQGILKDSDPDPMRRAVAFCQNIKVSNKTANAFNLTKEVYFGSLEPEAREELVLVNAQHVDGGMNTPTRDEKLSWLKSASEDSRECRILTNVRCLSEGVDVPSLDAVLFLSARNSQVDVVQSVGRVMRLAPGKKYGYIIIPVVVPVDIEPEKALNDNERFRVVWTVLNALRAHDDRFNATVNKIELNKRRPDQIIVGTMDIRPGDDIEYGNQGTADRTVGRSADPGNNVYPAANSISRQLAVQFEQLQGVVFARMVEKVGDRRYWERWAKDVAIIAERHIERINRLIRDGGAHQRTFAEFLAGLQRNINPSIAEPEAVEMLAQHIITKPVFEALFEGYSFVKNNPISVSMQAMLDLLEDQQLDKDAETLQKFYDSVRARAAGIDNAEGKQRIIVELYDKFFKSAFPKMVEQLGIVYTPVEVVDFIVHSTDALLRKEFGRSLSDENIHILDPFTGTGTFMTRLLQSGLIRPEDLERKYAHELHANEIVLLAYYIAAINIENAYHDATPDPDDGIGKAKYTPFDGIVLTDTFQLGETDDAEKLFSTMFPQNSARVQAQQKAPLRVIIGNPPYSVGQTSANDNAQNQEYVKLNARIAQTYAAATDATNKNSLYDSYIKAFRWASDRLDPKHGGIIAFVSNGAWIDGNATEGLRKCFEKEFTSVYVFNLRGNQRTSGELSRKEGGKIFGSGSRTPIAITFLVKRGGEGNRERGVENGDSQSPVPNPQSQVPDPQSQIYYHDIGDYLSREEKLGIVKKFGSVESMEGQWQVLQPNEYGDWLNQRDDGFGQFIPLGDKDNKSNNKTFFVPLYSNGVKTQRDGWCYNSSKTLLETTIQRTLDFYNEQRQAFLEAKKEMPNLKVKDFISYDDAKFSWSDNPINGIGTNKEYMFEQQSVVVSIYRPFFKQILYFSRSLNERVYQIPKLFPTPTTENRVICVSAAKDGIPVLMSDCIPDLHFNGDTQCFPLYYYEDRPKAAPSLFDAVGEPERVRRDGVSDFILAQARTRYGDRVTKEDVFYYVYGFLHSPDYRERYSSDLKKMLPRLPLVESPKDFWAFSKTGRLLADLHLGYDDFSKAPSAEAIGVVVLGIGEQGFGNGEQGVGAPQSLVPNPQSLYKVEKMRFPSKTDKSRILYNSYITIENIPAEAYEYVVNGKSAIEWVMERYAVTVHKDSGIRNDPNDWAAESGKPRYILDVLLSVIRLSVETVELVRGLPSLNL